MEDYVVLDTNVASSLFKLRRYPAALAEHLRGRPTAITFATIGEMTVWAEQRNWGPEKQAQLQHWLSTHHLISGDEAAARTWGRLTAAARRRGRTPQVNDTWIAACCITADLPLATLNSRDFVDFVSHHGLDLVDEITRQGV